MSDELDLEDESNEHDSEGIKNLRKQYNATKKERDEFQKELAAYRQKERSATVAEILKAKGIPSSAAKFYTAEDASEDAVGKWVEENADIFGKPSSPAEKSDPNAEAAQRVAGASFGNHGGIETQAGIGGRVLGDPEEIAHALKTLPYEELQKMGLMPPSGLYGAR